jgi:hypothetical protein
LTTPAKDGPFGFCHFAARPGDLVALDTFYVGKLKGIGPVWQLTAVDTATRYGIGKLVAGDKSARDAAAFVDHVAERLCGIGVELAGVLTDNGRSVLLDCRFGQVGRVTVKPSWLAAAAIRSS